jgi:hypothetical protein
MRTMKWATLFKTAALGAGVVATLSLATPKPADAAPSTGHPRLWITPADVTRLQGWANPVTNPMYKNGLAVAAAAAKAHADASWNYNTGVPNANWHDTGSTSWEGDVTEAYAEMFAFMSLVDPNPANRPQWAMRARVLLMWAMNQAAQGVAAGLPFRDPQFPDFNRANIYGEAWGLTVDWIYPSLSAADKATVRKVFLIWSNEILNIANRSGGGPYLPGKLNDPRVLGIDPTLPAATNQGHEIQFRWAANNYFLGETRTLSLMAMSFDAADDPAVDPTKPVSQVGNSLGSFVNDTMGWWLYQIYALFETPSVTKLALGLSQTNASFGIASGGLPVEGSLYGESLGFLGETLLAMHTAGYDDTTLYGPQAGFMKSPYWDKTIDGIFHSIAPAPYQPSQASGFAFQGQTWPVATSGDTLRTWVEDATFTLAGTVGLFDLATNNQTRLGKSRWIGMNAMLGGSANLYQRAANVWGNSYATTAILYYMLYDPAAATPPDPRPTLPIHFTAPAIGTIYARSDWTPNASWVSFRCGWETINHISGDCGQFQFYRKGQWLTKEWSNYANDWNGYTPLYHNILGLQNDTPAISGSIWDTTVATGGQWNNGGNAGDPSIWLSANDNWAYSQTDATNLYNHQAWFSPSQAATDIKTAARSAVWLNPDYMVVYDRGTSGKSGRFKRFNLVMMAKPTITGTVATATAGGQTLTVQSLMPANPTIREEHFWKTNAVQEVNQTSYLDTSFDRLIIEDPTGPTNIRFLTVLQGTDAGVPALPATGIHSSAGAAFDGAVVGNYSVVFPVTLGQAFTSTSYAVPTTATRHLITGLTPGVAYSVTLTPGNGVTNITVATGTGYIADVGGVIGVGFPPSASPTDGGVVIGQGLINPNTSPAPSSGGTSSGVGTTTTGGTSTGGTSTGGTSTGGTSTGMGDATGPGVYTKVNGGYTGHGEPTTLIAEGVYYYDMNGQRTYQQHSGFWNLIPAGGALAYTKVGTGYQGAGAPVQLIANGISYYDTVGKRTFKQQGSTWVLLP